jgi:hypothetical protein
MRCKTRDGRGKRGKGGIGGINYIYRNRVKGGSTKTKEDRDKKDNKVILMEGVK